MRKKRLTNCLRFLPPIFPIGVKSALAKKKAVPPILLYANIIDKNQMKHNLLTDTSFPTIFRLILHENLIYTNNIFLLKAKNLFDSKNKYQQKDGALKMRRTNGEKRKK